MYADIEIRIMEDEEDVAAANDYHGVTAKVGDFLLLISESHEKKVAMVATAEEIMHQAGIVVRRLDNVRSAL